MIVRTTSIVLTAVALLCAGLAPAAPEIRYLGPERAVWIRGFRYGRPATMDDVLAADRSGGWDRVTFDPETDTFTVKASLWIGGTASWDPTYVQLGRQGHPREIVVVHGNVWIRPPRTSMERVDGRPGLVNRLTLGSPTQTNVSACLKIACETPEQYGLFIGQRDKEHGTVFGGELNVYHSTITAAVQDHEHRLRGADWYQGMHTGWYASRVELVGASISWVDHCVGYGLRKGSYRIQDCTFDHCSTVLVQGHHEVTGCRFLNLTGPAINAISIRFIRCTFRDNAQNWAVQHYTGRFAEMINCDIGQPQQPLQLMKNVRSPKVLLRYGCPVYPFYVERTSCVVHVHDENGAPLRGAVVSLQCEDDPLSHLSNLSAVRHPVAVTDEHGRTPVRAEDGAILPAVLCLQATNDPEAPREHTLTYELLVEAVGYERTRQPLPLLAIGTVQQIQLTPLK